jgi:hypothetical protein
LQREEQRDVHAFLPSHHARSPLGCEQTALTRQEFLQLVKDEGEGGLKQFAFARKHKRESRSNPKQAYKCKCNSSVHGAPSAGRVGSLGPPLHPKALEVSENVFFFGLGKIKLAMGSG